MYALFADRLARTGALLHRDPLVGAVDAFHPFLEGKKYPGFYIYGHDLIVPQFFPGPFAFLGLGNLAGGLWGSLFVVPVMGALAIGLAFALGKELFGRWAGLVGASLLALSYAQVWWARQPSSEIMTQLSVLAGLWLGVRFVRGAGPLTGVLAGVLLGGVMLVRVDAFLAAAAVPLLFAYDLLTHRPAWRWLYPGVPLALFAGATVLYLNTVGARYLYVIYAEHGLREALALAPYAAIAAVLLAGAFLYVRARWGRGIGTYLEVSGGRYALGFAMCLGALALWAYFLLPVPWDALPNGSRDFGAYRTQVLVRLVWFTTPVVAVLGLIGFVLTARRLDAARVLLLGAFLGFGVLYAAVPNVSPDLPWATRRFVPAAFPILSLLAGYATVEAGRWLGRAWRPRVGVALSVTLRSVRDRVDRLHGAADPGPSGVRRGRSRASKGWSGRSPTPRSSLWRCPTASTSRPLRSSTPTAILSYPTTGYASSVRSTSSTVRGSSTTRCTSPRTAGRHRCFRTWTFARWGPRV